MAVCCVLLLLSEQCAINYVYTKTMRKQLILTNLYHSDSIIWNRFKFGTGSNGFDILEWTSLTAVSHHLQLIKFLSKSITTKQTNLDISFHFSIHRFHHSNHIYRRSLAMMEYFLDENLNNKKYNSLKSNKRKYKKYYKHYSTYNQSIIYF